MIRILFVCLGNICRSPSAEGVMRDLVSRAGLAHKIEIDSAGTGAWHIGEPPDARAVKAAAARGLDLSGQRARQISAADFGAFDYILAMDRKNLEVLKRMRPRPQKKTAALHLFLVNANTGQHDVPDPYYGDAADFDIMLDLIEAAAHAFLLRLVAEGGLAFKPEFR